MESGVLGQPWWCGEQQSAVPGSACIWPRYLSPAWCLAVPYGAGLAQIGSFRTHFTPFPDFSLCKMGVRIFSGTPVFSFSLPRCSQAASMKFVCHFRFLAQATEVAIRTLLSFSTARQVLKNMHREKDPIPHPDIAAKGVRKWN